MRGIWRGPGAVALALIIGVAWNATAQTILPGSLVNGIESTTHPLTNAVDPDYLTYAEIVPTTDTGTTVSFVVDLGAEMEVSSVAMYGFYIYRAAQVMLSDEIVVAASDAGSTGPWSVIGSIDVGNTRPTDPDPDIGGVNPWTGGNGRRIPCTPTTTRYLRVWGEQGFDNLIRITHLQINPEIVLHEVDPVYEGVPFNPWDPGGGVLNSRVGVDMVDGRLDTRCHIGTSISLTLDLGTSQSVQEIRLLTADNDAFAMVETGEVRVSSTDDPLNFDVLETAFDASLPGGQDYAVARIILPNAPTRRFFELTCLTDRDGDIPDGTTSEMRIGEIEVRTPDQLPLLSPSVVVGSVEGGLAGTGNEDETRAFDFDYAVYFQISQAGQDRASFVVDLGGTHEVRSVGMYGYWQYVTQVQLFGGDVVVEAADGAAGPWTEIGSITLEGERPTDPDPDIGGENPWTGGNGRLIPCEPTEATHLRISGAFTYDNVVRLYEAIINPPAVIHEVIPVDQGRTLWDVGGLPYNSRCGAELVDGNVQTRVNPQSPFAATLDLGAVRTIEKLRFYAWESQTSAIPTQGTIRVSSNDTPLNMDDVVMTFNETYIGGGLIEVELPTPVARRFVQIEFPQSNLQFGEIEVLTGPPPPPVNRAEHWMLY